MAGRIHPLSLLPPSVTLRVATTSELRRQGATKTSHREAVSAGSLLRVRRGRYLPADTHPDVVTAAAQGGRLDCVSLLGVLGVFVLESSALHLHIAEGASRLPRRHRRVIRHWRRASGDPCSTVADIEEALAQAVRCQPPRAAIATLDSALHLRLIDDDGLDRVFASLPRRYAALKPLVDGAAESGTETLVRLILRTLGCRVEVQVRIVGVGRVDLLVDGWLIVECDSRAHHGSWDDVRRDRRRDAEAAAQGYVTVRLLAEDVFGAADEVGRMLRRILESHPRRPELLLDRRRRGSRPRRPAAAA